MLDTIIVVAFVTQESNNEGENKSYSNENHCSEPMLKKRKQKRTIPRCQLVANKILRYLCARLYYRILFHPRNGMKKMENVASFAILPLQRVFFSFSFSFFHK